MKTSMLLTSSAVLLAAIAARPAVAQVVCGATIGPGEKITLTADVATCTSATDPALTIVGPATVDMAGHRVVCNAADRPDVGILLTGKGVKLLTGSILDCGTASGHGLHVSGEGKHKVEDFVVQGSQNHGVRINPGADGNSLKRVASNDNAEGFESDSDKNKFEDLVAIGNDSTGFDSEDDGDKLKRVTFVGNGGDGFNPERNGSSIKEGVFIDNGEDGADLDGSGNKIEKSVAIRNGVASTESGFDIAGPGNQVSKSRVFASGEAGIGVGAGAQGTVVKSNLALGNPTDLVDESPGGTCDGNQWKKNVFGTSNADGTSSPACIE